MNVKKTVLWSVLSWLTGILGAVSALVVVGYAVWRTMGGDTLNETVRFEVLGKFSFDVTMTKFIIASAISGVLILLSVICKGVGKAVYNKRLKKAIEEASLANSGKRGMFGMTPEKQEQVAQTAKKLIPVVAAVATACVVAGAVKKSRKKKKQTQMGMGMMQMPRYYPY
jgi:hypothetical protein